MLRAFEPWHLVVIGGVAMLLFGAKRLPDSARSVGQSLRIFRSEFAAAKDGAPAAPAPGAVQTAAGHVAAPEQIAPAAPVGVSVLVPAGSAGSATPMMEQVAASRHSGV
jgi:sec-independent protein translocase protein TatA